MWTRCPVSYLDYQPSHSTTTTSRLSSSPKKTIWTTPRQLLLGNDQLLTPITNSWTSWNKNTKHKIKYSPFKMLGMKISSSPKSYWKSSSPFNTMTGSAPTSVIVWKRGRGYHSLPTTTAYSSKRLAPTRKSSYLILSSNAYLFSSITPSLPDILEAAKYIGASNNISIGPLSSWTATPKYAPAQNALGTA